MRELALTRVDHAELERRQIYTTSRRQRTRDQCIYELGHIVGVVRDRLDQERRDAEEGQ